MQEIHVDRRVVGWSAGRHVDRPCGGGEFRHGLLEKSVNGSTLKNQLKIRLRTTLLHEPFSAQLIQVWLRSDLKRNERREFTKSKRLRVIS